MFFLLLMAQKKPRRFHSKAFIGWSIQLFKADTDI